MAWGKKKKPDITGGKGKSKEPWKACGKPIHSKTKRLPGGGSTTPICTKRRGHFGGC